MSGLPLGFESSLWLWALAVLPLLAWLHLRRRRRPPARVSSLVVWRSIVQPVLPRRRPRLPLLLLVQAVLIAACTAALAGLFGLRPMPPAAPRDAVVVLDVSASMQAKLDGTTRFAAARDAAIARVQELGAEGRRITLVAAGVQPRILGTGLAAEQAADLLRREQALDVAGNLTAATELAATQAGASGSVDLFGDTPRDDLVLSHDARAATAVHRFGTSADNVAIVGLRVQTSPFDQPGRGRVLVTLRSFADAPWTGAVELAPLAPVAGSTGRAQGSAPASALEGSPASLRDDPRASAPAGASANPAAGAHPVRREISLAPGATEVLSIDGLPWEGAFEARLLPGDALPLDDRAFGFLPPARPLQVLLVSDDAALARAFEGLGRRLGRLAVRSVGSAEYRPGSAAEITLFDRVAPPIPPAGNTAYLAPRQGNPDVSIVGETIDARFAELRAHELIAGVQNPETLLGERLVGLASGGPLRPVLLGRAEGREAALVLAGESGGRRVVATAFGLEPEALGDADAIPTLVFTLNLLRWLAPGAEDAPLERLAGERLRAAAVGEAPLARIVGPDGARDLAPTEDVALDRAGRWTVLSGERTRDLLVSFVDPSESDVRRPPLSPAAPSVTPGERAAPTAAAGDATARVGLGREVLLVALAAMLLEWLLIGGGAIGAARRAGG